MNIPIMDRQELKKLKPRTIHLLSADEIIERLREENSPRPDVVAGVSDGSAELARELARKFKAKSARLKKTNGRIEWIEPLRPGQSVLFVQGWFRRQGFKVAAQALLEQCPEAKILPYYPVVINSGPILVFGFQGLGGPIEVLAMVRQGVKKREQNGGRPVRAKGSEPIET